MADAPVEGALEHETLPMPELDYRWVHTGSQYLDLLPTPITTAATIYKAFSPDESRRIQEAWDAFTPEERQKAIHDWGRKEGEGFATPATKGKEKDKEKEKERRGSNVSARSVREGEEVVRSGEELPNGDEKDSDGNYKDFLATAQQEYENLELISGVPVSQVSSFYLNLLSRGALMIGLAFRGIPKVSLAPSCILGACWSTCISPQRLMVRYRRDQTLFLGFRRGAREGLQVSLSQSLSRLDLTWGDVADR